MAQNKNVTKKRITLFVNVVASLSRFPEQKRKIHRWELMATVVEKRMAYDVRNLMGEDLGPLSRKELETLESQLDSSLKQIRSTRSRLSSRD
ncbi:hypothetical protein TSUD_98100 [Trifolium subterraneum]|uniref:K-box domain-containing protein n=1 Tax=Trifolium subterraneum TaxID=3900 RepID=A0A2Z6MBT9_TRISU|nr:hypothetical protein TSUD_98100 [Trifolium subterraneum]